MRGAVSQLGRDRTGLLVTLQEVTRALMRRGILQGRWPRRAGHRGDRQYRGREEGGHQRGTSDRPAASVCRDGRTPGRHHRPSESAPGAANDAARRATVAVPGPPPIDRRAARRDQSITASSDTPRSSLPHSIGRLARLPRTTSIATDGTRHLVNQEISFVGTSASEANR
jgi:hypothetical protein